MAKTKKKKTPNNSSTIALNKRARHDYHISDRTEAGVALTGWEVKSMRDGRANLTDSYVLMKGDEAWLVGAHVTPLNSASTHVIANPTRDRKLLLHRREIDRIEAQINQKGYTCIALALYWKANKIKCEIGLGKGKKEYDKRADDKARDWGREKARILRKDQ